MICTSCILEEGILSPGCGARWTWGVSHELKEFSDALRTGSFHRMKLTFKRLHICTTVHAGLVGVLMLHETCEVYGGTKVPY